jgi:hypothetical protein
MNKGAYEQYDDHARMLVVLRKRAFHMQKSGRCYFELRELAREIDLLFRHIFDVSKYEKKELTQFEIKEIEANRKALSDSPQGKRSAFALT